LTIKNSFVTFVSSFGSEERDNVSKANCLIDKFSKRSLQFNA
jgi:hypothetical protein